jgi:SsrA-binding protein
LRIFINEKGLAKMEVGVAKGKKLYDKRESIKRRDSDREIKRNLNRF